MAKVKVPFVVADEKQTDDYNLTSYSRQQINGYFSLGIASDGSTTANWNKRPGMLEWCDLGVAAKVDGLYWWPRQQKIVATCGGRTFFINQDGTFNEKTGTATMVAGVRPTYADIDGTTLYQASSGQIGKYTAAGGNVGVYISDVDAPTNVTHIAVISRVLLALRANSQRFDWSNTNDPDTWESKFANAETLSDLARGLYISEAQIYIPGEDSTEVWRDNGSTFVREFQGYIESGTVAPYSTVFVGGEGFWLNQKREVIRFTGRKATAISTPYAKFLQRLATVSDALGDYIQVDGKQFYKLTFPTANRTLVYDLDLDRWCEWTNVAGPCVTSRLWGFTVVGSSTTGKIYKFSTQYKDDAGTLITTTLRTAEVDHGSPDAIKFARRLTFYFKRTATATTPATMSFRYRDNGKQAWSSTRTIPIEANSTTELKHTIRQLGSYRTRQYEFTFDTASGISFVEAEEDVDYGG